jgi:hypothetical protein
MIKYIVALGHLSLTLACSPRADGRAAEPAETAVAAVTPISIADARAFAEQRYHEHFASGQGLSVDTLRARRAWFTPRLYQEMLDDMSSTGEIGYIDFDPFTDSQDDAASYTAGKVRLAHDTALVEVEVTFPPGVGNGHEERRITLAMLQTPAGWQIANFVYPDRDLANDLTRAARR